MNFLAAGYSYLVEDDGYIEEMLCAAVSFLRVETAVSWTKRYLFSNLFLSYSFVAEIVT